MLYKNQTYSYLDLQRIDAFYFSVILVLSKVVTTPQFLHEKSFFCLLVPREGNEVKSIAFAIAFPVTIGPEAACVLRAGKLPVRTRGVTQVLAAQILDVSTKIFCSCCFKLFLFKLK